MKRKVVVPVAAGLVLGVGAELIRDSLREVVGPPSEHVPHADHVPFSMARAQQSAVSGVPSSFADWPNGPANEIEIPEGVRRVRMPTLPGWED